MDQAASTNMVDELARWGGGRGESVMERDREEEKREECDRKRRRGPEGWSVVERES